MSIAKWRPHLEAWATSGMSKAAYARKHQIDYHQFIYWAGKYERYKQKRSDLIEVKLPHHEPSAASQPCLGVIEYTNGVKLHIHHPDLLRSLPEWGA